MTGSRKTRRLSGPFRPCRLAGGGFISPAAHSAVRPAIRPVLPPAPARARQAAAFHRCAGADPRPASVPLPRTRSCRSAFRRSTLAKSSSGRLMAIAWPSSLIAWTASRLPLFNRLIRSPVASYSATQPSLRADQIRTRHRRALVDDEPCARRKLHAERQRHAKPLCLLVRLDQHDAGRRQARRQPRFLGGEAEALALRWLGVGPSGLGADLGPRRIDQRRGLARPASQALRQASPRERPASLCPSAAPPTATRRHGENRDGRERSDSDDSLVAALRWVICNSSHNGSR